MCESTAFVVGFACLDRCTVADGVFCHVVVLKGHGTACTVDHALIIICRILYHGCGETVTDSRGVIVAVEERDDTADVGRSVGIDCTAEEAVLDSTVVDYTADTAGLVLTCLDTGVRETVLDCSIAVDVAYERSNVVATFDIGFAHYDLLNHSRTFGLTDDCNVGISRQVDVHETDVLDERT